MLCLFIFLALLGQVTALNQAEGLNILLKLDKLQKSQLENFLPLYQYNEYGLFPLKPTDVHADRLLFERCISNYEDYSYIENVTFVFNFTFEVNNYITGIKVAPGNLFYQAHLPEFWTGVLGDENFSKFIRDIAGTQLCLANATGRIWVMRILEPESTTNQLTFTVTYNSTDLPAFLYPLTVEEMDLYLVNLQTSDFTRFSWADLLAKSQAATVPLSVTTTILPYLAHSQTVLDTTKPFGELHTCNQVQDTISGIPFRVIHKEDYFTIFGVDLKGVMYTRTYANPGFNYQKNVDSAAVETFTPKYKILPVDFDSMFPASDTIYTKFNHWVDGFPIYPIGLVWHYKDGLSSPWGAGPYNVTTSCDCDALTSSTCKFDLIQRCMKTITPSTDQFSLISGWNQDGTSNNSLSADYFTQNQYCTFDIVLGSMFRDVYSPLVRSLRTYIGTPYHYKSVSVGFYTFLGSTSRQQSYKIYPSRTELQSRYKKHLLIHLLMKKDDKCPSGHCITFYAVTPDIDTAINNFRAVSAYFKVPIPLTIDRALSFTQNVIQNSKDNYEALQIIFGIGKELIAKLQEMGGDLL